MSPLLSQKEVRYRSPDGMAGKITTGSQEKSDRIDINETVFYFYRFVISFYDMHRHTSAK
ncbi:hypothetical protein NH00_02700 [Enterobacter cancerogenus]|nr:hypothetical protein NH00_02700 [Enterobacter cancerogenus]